MSGAGVRRWIVLVPLLLACGRSPESGEPFLARFLERDPGGRFRPEELIAVEPVDVLGGDGCPIERGWTIELPPAERECLGPSLVLTSSRPRIVLEREVGFDAAKVDAFHVVVRGLTRQTVALEWRGAGEDYDPARRVEDTVRLVAGGDDGIARLAVGEHPGWRGPVAGLRLTLSVAPNRKARLLAVTAARETLDEPRLEEVAAGAWKIDLDNDMRSGVVGLPGRPWRWRVEVPADAELTFAYGRAGSCRGEVGFEVRAAAGDGAAEPLFDARLPCERDGWHEARVPLGERSGPLTLEFATAADGLDPIAGLPVWSGPEIAAGRAPGGLGLVLISIDTLRPDHLSLYGYPRRTTPRLDERAARGAVVFERAVASAPWTLPSHASIFTGLDAVRHGVNQQRGLPPSLLTLAEILREAGFATHAITGGGFVHQQYGFAQGFDVYWSFAARMGFAGELDAGVRQAKATLEALRDRRFFLFFHTYAVHNPFLPRQPHLERLTGRTTDAVVGVDHRPPIAADGFQTRRSLIRRDRGRRVDSPAAELNALAADLYDSGIAYTDERLDDLLAGLDGLGLTERTLIVVTSDHGELFGEHGEVNHYSLYDENVLVPLVVFDPARRGRLRRVRGQVRSIDLVPTILERLGLPVPPGLDGRSFAPVLADDDDGAAGTGDAWSYASASNYGIALRRPDGTAYTARNDAWVAPGPRERMLAAPAGGGGPAALRAAAERRLGRALAGVRVRCRNPGPESYRLTVLEAHAIPSRMKLERIGEGVLRLAEDEGATVTVAPGDDLTLVVEGATLATLHLVIDHPLGSRTINVKPEELETRRFAGWAGGDWQVGETEPPDGGLVSFWWQGKGADDEAEAPDDEDLRSRLRALGYLR